MPLDKALSGVLALVARLAANGRLMASPGKALKIVERVKWGVAVAAYTDKSPSGQEVGAPAGVLRVAFDFVDRCNSETGLLNPSYEKIAD